MAGDLATMRVPGLLCFTPESYWVRCWRGTQIPVIVGTPLQCRGGHWGDTFFRDPEMVYPRITGVKVIPRLSPGYQFLKVMDNAFSEYVLQCTVIRYSRDRQDCDRLALNRVEQSSRCSLFSLFSLFAGRIVGKPSSG